MKKIMFLCAALVLALSAPAFGQIGNILNKVKEKTKETKEKTKETVDSSSAAATTGTGNGALKVDSDIKNSGVQLVLTTKEYKTFDEAKPNAVNRVTDGEYLWMYVKFNGGLAKYAHRMQYADSEGNINYVLFFEIGAQGEESSYDDASLVFTKEQLNVNELKIALAPGAARENKSLPIFLETVGGGNPGLWKNEIRISNSPTMPRGINDYLAKTLLDCDVSEGLAQYRKMLKNYASIAYVGTAEENKLPEAGKFVNAAIKTQILNKLKAEDIVPAKFYFTDNDWSEYSDSQTNEKLHRKVYAAYTYQVGAECFYGIAEVVQNYSYVTARYGETLVYLRKGFPILCSNLK